MSSRNGLTAKQRRFIEEYLVDLNATQAAIRAGYSEKTAEQVGYQQLQKTSVAEAIQRAMKERSERTRITIDRVLEELAVIAFSDMRSFATWGANGVSLKDSTTLPESIARAVSEASQTVTQHGGTIRLKLHDKVAALKQLGEHLGVFGAKGLDGEEFGEIARMSDEELERARKRLKMVT